MEQKEKEWKGDNEGQERSEKVKQKSGVGERAEKSKGKKWEKKGEKEKEKKKGRKEIKEEMGRSKRRVEKRTEGLRRSEKFKERQRSLPILALRVY